MSTPRVTSDVTNCFDPAAKRPKLDVQRAWLFKPETEWTYSHHASLAFFKGRYYAIWSNGREHEDDVGQRILISSSVDFKDWTSPGPLVDTLSGRHSERVLTAAGFHEYQGTLAAYFGAYEYEPECLVDGHRQPSDTSHFDVSLWVLTTEDGENWTEPRDLGMPIVPNHGPQSTPSGRLIISGNVKYPYTDDPSGISGWKHAGCYDAAKCADIPDDSGGFWRIQKRMGWDYAVCEGSFYATDDGILHMLLRGYSGYLWISESLDDGVTWCEPVETNFTDDHTKFHCGRLPDGRFYHVGTPDPHPAPRCPLAISLSNDGIVFDRAFIIANEEYEIKRPGMHKGGQYGYPHTLIHNGYLHVIVSRRKEAVEVLRFPLDALL